MSRGSGNGTSEARPGGAERRRSRAWIAAAPALGSGEWLLWPDGLPLLLLVPLAWLALAARDRARARRLEALAGPRAARSARGAWSRRLRRTLLAGGFGFALLALLQPAFGPGEQHGVPRGLDLVVCLDLSRSMLARDVAPSRLARARAEIRALAERVRGDRLALVTFAGDARLAVPLTRDRQSFADLVDLADPATVTRGGTDLGAALDAALGAVPEDLAADAAIVLVTDGEDLEQRGLAAARRCAERGVAVHCLGLGSTLGSKIAVEGPDGETFLRDASGEEVVSALDRDGLAAIAAAGSGRFVTTERRTPVLAELYDHHLAGAARASRSAAPGEGRRNRFQWPLLAAFVLLILELGFGGRSRRGGRAPEVQR